ncbi:MAG: hypothetical protein GKR90_04940 [Pseudomonadales bacterium]|nr:hypothetical protein [Pseudomonadales bacterium]
MVHEQKNMTTPLWVWSDLAQALGHPAIPGPDIHRFQTDSRTVQEGDLFIALPGDPGPRFNPSYRSDVDGHNFIADAVRRGAVGVLAHNRVETGVPVLYVENTYDGLWALGRASSERMSGSRLAITGSSGKTTAKSFLTSALDAYSAPGSFNNHIGVPISLANMPADTVYGVFEVGTNHAGEIAPLTGLIQPDIAIVLNVGNAHLENFDDQEALYNEKISIFKELEDKSNAVWHESLNQSFGRSFGLSNDADAKLVSLTGDRARYRLFGDEVSARVPGGGEHRAMTLAAVLLATVLSEGNLAKALELSADLVPKGRGNEVLIGDITIIDDSYNANPASMSAAIQTLCERSGRRRIAVLGEMLELGKLGIDTHRAVLAESHPLERVMCIGSAFQEPAEVEGLPWFQSADEEALDWLISIVRPGDDVLVKGSNKVFWQSGFVQAVEDQIRKTFLK